MMLPRLSIRATAALLLTALVVTAGGVLAHSIRTLRTELAQEQAAHATYRTEVAQAAQREEAKRRTTETKLQEKTDEHAQTLQAQIDNLQRNRATLDADNQRLRKLAKIYASYSGAAGAPASFASASQTANARAGVLADMLAETDRLAGVYAAEADESRLRGQGCEAAYDAARAVTNKDDAP